MEQLSKTRSQFFFQALYEALRNVMKKYLLAVFWDRVQRMKEKMFMICGCSAKISEFWFLFIYQVFALSSHRQTIELIKNSSLK